MQSLSEWRKSCDIITGAIANLAWNYNAVNFDKDFVKVYARSTFSNQADEAIKAFTLLRSITDKFPLKNNEDTTSSIYSLLSAFMDAPSCYQCQNKALCFPENVLKTILSDRKSYENHLRKAFNAADTACRIFDTIRNEAETYLPLMRFYSLTASIYREFISDILTFLELHDLSHSQTLSKAILKRIKKTLFDRISSIHNIIEEGEMINAAYKIDFDQASLSMVLQVFKDLLEHMRTAKGRSLRFDMTNLENIKGNLFKSLL